VSNLYEVSDRIRAHFHQSADISDCEESEGEDEGKKKEKDIAYFSYLRRFKSAQDRNVSLKIHHLVLALTPVCVSKTTAALLGFSKAFRDQFQMQLHEFEIQNSLRKLYESADYLSSLDESKIDFASEHYNHIFARALSDSDNFFSQGIFSTSAQATAGIIDIVFISSDNHWISSVQMVGTETVLSRLMDNPHTDPSLWLSIQSVNFFDLTEQSALHRSVLSKDPAGKSQLIK